MSLLKDPQFARQIIMDHYENPHNKHHGDSDYAYKHMESESCIDDIIVYVKIENNRVIDVCFEGHACTIATSAASIMTDLIKGKEKEDALKIMHEYMKMMQLEPYDEGLLDEAIVFRNVGRQSNRIGCATLGWRAVGQILSEDGDHNG
ncbi:iron-sulfur cluster assembly scaffold protein [Erysipelothrix larvae]|uniref:Iron-sulfur cluster assembly scaffold protein n=1 Tax=Erysipelothrix larvae TaxID=1514105 RepID=A0A109UH35_9FIRM|nr:SUF system NifU family Fe-S cluster assembly protein [Erysipelothrix larvae]AMC93528.1 iron-sulfur cluster assembly scaffold protein [Erysipelothrix larvae]